MASGYRVTLTSGALDDLQRIEDFLVELALRHGDFNLPTRAVQAIRQEIGVLSRNPYTCRKTDHDPHERELIIPFGGSGFVALFHILDAQSVVVSALRHQREDDYH